jgi:hypothetical protein
MDKFIIVDFYINKITSSIAILDPEGCYHKSENMTLEGTKYTDL